MRTLDENVETIKDWERALLHERSRAEQLGDWITATAGSSRVLAIHVIWFSAWIALNVGAFGTAPFDPFPFPFLTMAVSLEAIFLALFVLASQNSLVTPDQIRDLASKTDLKSLTHRVDTFESDVQEEGAA